MIKIEKIFNKILDLIYPNVCGICGEICKNNVCDNCNKKIEKLLLCLKDEYNDENIFYNEHMYLFKYENYIREKIIQYKFKEKPYMYRAFSELFIKNEKICNFLKSYDIITSVPIHRKRKNERGYNQSHLIAKEISKNTENIIYKNNLLYKIKNIKPQSSLNKVERIENIKDAYEVQDKEIISNKKIIIFDDIYTTGSTANECAKFLKKAGAQKIGILTIAKD